MHKEVVVRGNTEVSKAGMTKVKDIRDKVEAAQ
jgi:hypothetical protein